MQDKVLLDLGLSKNEAKVYMAMVNMGTSTVGQIADKSKVHRTNVYDALERLINKGLASYITKDKVKYFEAADPSNLMNLLKVKEDELKQLIPSLLLNRKLSKKTEVTVFEGTAAARSAFINLLRYKEEIDVLGVPKDAPVVLGDFFLKRFHRERIAAKIPERAIYNEDAAKRIGQLKRIALCEVRSLPKGFDSPMSINICGEEVFFELYSRVPCLTIQIKSRDVADIYKKYFEVMWKTAKKL